MKNTDLNSEDWELHVKLVCDQLNEKHRRWVAGLLSETLGWGGTKRIAELTSLDPKTIRQGRIDLGNNLEEYSLERIRAKGAGRPSLKKRPSN
ncbi:MAG: transposase [Methyloprofundus sp.]|nr:transposase [Methyloprofundus sp.]